MDTSIIRQFEGKNVRTHWNSAEEQWYFSIVDVVGILAESDNPTVYWRVLKKRLLDEGNETVTNCNALKMKAADGKMRKTDVANTEQLLRIVQSIPSKKAEPFKQWLAKVGAERIQEVVDPEAAIQRAMEYYAKKGYSEGWIRQRLMSIEMRKELTSEWQQCGVRKGSEFAILTDDISRAWSGMSTREYKDFKGLTNENLRDNMSNTELVLNMLAETTTTEISRAEEPEGFEESCKVAKRGGAVAGNARKMIEAETGKPVVTSMNALDFAQVIMGVLAQDSVEQMRQISVANGNADMTLEEIQAEIDEVRNDEDAYIKQVSDAIERGRVDIAAGRYYEGTEAFLAEIERRKHNEKNG